MTRTDWTREEIADLFDLPFTAARLPRRRRCIASITPRIRSSSAPCCRSRPAAVRRIAAIARRRRAPTSGVKATKLMDVRAVLQSAAQAKDHGSQRFCMGAAWRNPKDRDMPAIVEIVKGVAAMGMETCMTLGMLTPAIKRRSSRRRASITTTTTSTLRRRITRTSSPRAASRSGSTRWRTCDEAGINVCSGGIVGMGETRDASRRLRPRARHAAASSRERAGQRVGAGQGHAAWRHARRLRRWRRSTISNLSAPSRSRGSPCRARWCG